MHLTLASIMAMIFLIKNLDGRRCSEPKGPYTHRSPGKAGNVKHMGPLLR